MSNKELEIGNHTNIVFQELFMKSFQFLTTRKIHHTPTSGAKLISLDYNYTKEYNCNYEVYVTQFNHLLLECKLSHKGASLVANTPSNYIQKLKNLFCFYFSIESILKYLMKYQRVEKKRITKSHKKYYIYNHRLIHLSPLRGGQS